jgi:glycine cleavage system H lipoate-binding protein/ABC-type phosphate transport system substrate-binding protein
MKRIMFLLISLLLINYCNIWGNSLVSGSNSVSNDSITVLSTPDLFDLSFKWVSEYNRLHPESKIRVQSISDIKSAERLFASGTIGIVSNEYFTGSENENLWKMVIGRDVIVPIVNSKNPYSDEILRQGISPQALEKLFTKTGTRKWGNLLNNNHSEAINYYWINEESINVGIADFLKLKQIENNGIEVKDGKEMISAIQKDPLSIGFCKMVNLIDYKDQGIAENIRLLPIDRNGNGLIDYNEKIYDDLNSLARGVWIGKYPKLLFNNIYSVSSDQPKSENEVAFLKWVLTDGQQFLSLSGFSDLMASERQLTVDKLNVAPRYSNATADSTPAFVVFLMILGGVIIAGFVLNVSIRFVKNRKASVQPVTSEYRNLPDENSIIIPKGLYFDKTHTWAFLEENGIVKVGVDDFLQHITGPVTRVKMDKVGKMVKKGDQILSIIQNGKQLNLYAPISGTIIEQNIDLDTNTSLINSSPYTDGWICKIDPTNWHRENQLLFMAEKQKEFLKNEFSRFKDFLAVVLNSDGNKYAQVVLQDGGELRDGTLSNLGPEIWEEFQTKFIDPSRQLWFYEMF